MRGRPSFGHALLMAMLAAGTTWAALLAWRGFLVDSGAYLGPLAVTALVVAAAGALLRWIGSPAVGTIAVQVLLAVAMVSSELGGGPLPLGATGGAVGRSLDQAVASARTYAAPIAADVPSVAPLLLVGGVFFVLLVDFLACTLRRVPVAGLALLAIYSVPAGLVQSGPGLVAFLLAATGFMALLQIDNRDHLLKWGRPLGPQESNPWLDANPVADAMRVGAGRIGVAATVCAVLLPPFVPVLDLDVFGLGPGDGDDNIQIRNPRVDLRGDLVREQDVPLVRFRTDDPAPSYLRIAVLNRFTGVEWSSGDRGVDDADTASGPLPAPQGLSPDVPRSVYDYDFEATAAFDSSWLPTMFPASSVEAEGDWRYDVDTMDFLAVPDDLTTEDLTWSAEGIRPSYGTTGEWFQDASLSAVDDEFLEVPSGLPSIVRNQALAQTEGTRNDYEAALRLQAYFRDNFRYSLDDAPDGIGADAFQQFLSEDGRTGYCEQFASAMAAMARIVGIPARVAIGFLTPRNLGDGNWEYSSHDLHAWPELYFEGAGWVRFEPTPQRRARLVPDYSTVQVDLPEPTETTSTQTSSAPTRDVRDPAETSQTATPKDEQVDRVDRADEGVGWATVLLRIALTALVLAVLAAIATTPRLLRRRIRARRLAGSPEDLWDELRATAVDLTLPWPSGRSPQEVGRVLVAHLGDRTDTTPPERPRTGPDTDPEAAAALDRLVRALEVVRYARPGSESVRPGLAEDARLCCASLEAGVSRTTALQARWWPRSLWQRPARAASDHDDLVGV